jgi:hypothetical protein
VEASAGLSQSRTRRRRALLHVRGTCGRTGTAPVPGCYLRRQSSVSVVRFDDPREFFYCIFAPFTGALEQRLKLGVFLSPSVDAVDAEL